MRRCFNYQYLVALVALLAMLVPIAANARAADVTVSGGWFRALPTPIPSGGYFNLHNSGAKSVTLTAVKSSACGAMMMHQTTARGMEHVMSIVVPAGETFSFSPGGYHLMCMASKLKIGTSIPVTLVFQDGPAVTANFQVRDVSGR